jgi:hypothetical protein
MTVLRVSPCTRPQRVSTSRPCGRSAALSSSARPSVGGTLRPTVEPATDLRKRARPVGGEQFSADDCYANQSLDASDADIPYDVPLDPESDGYNLGETDGCVSPFELPIDGAPFYRTDGYDESMCPEDHPRTPRAKGRLDDARA